jgi:hypothetical protein
LFSKRINFHRIKSTGSDRGMPRKDLVTLSAGVLPVYVFSFPLAQGTIRNIDKKEQTIFISWIYLKFSILTGSETKLHEWF